VEKVIPLVDGRSESPPESWVRVACVRAGLRLRCRSSSSWRPVSSWAGSTSPGPSTGCLEYEGAHHFDGLQIRRNDERYARVAASGWRIVRLSAADPRDLEAVVQRTADAIRASTWAS